MSILDSLVRITNSRWISIQLHQKMPPGMKPLRKAVRLCEAVHMANTQELCLTAENMACEGANHCLAWRAKGSEAIAQTLSRKTDVDVSVIESILKTVPTLTNNIVAITMGHNVEGDVFISYCGPEGVMKLCRKWQMLTGHSDHTSLSSVMAVCGNAIVKAYMSKEICLSFGCPDSRRYGEIHSHQLVIAVPKEIAVRLSGKQ